MRRNQARLARHRGRSHLLCMPRRGVFLRWRAHRAFRRGFRCGRRIVHGHRRRERFGKSTLAGILSGRNAGFAGSVEVGGVPIQEASRASLASTVTVVPFSSYLFKGSVRSNLLLADPQASDEELWRRFVAAAQKVRGAGGRARCSDSGGRRKPFGWSAAATRAGSRLAPRYACVRVRRGHVERRCGERASHRRGRP